VDFLTVNSVEDNMRKQFLIPVLAGILALGAAQAFAQSATVVMRNGDRVRAEVIDMGRNFSLNVNGQTRQVPIGDIVLIDFAGDGRNVTLEEVSKVNAANGGFVIMRNGEQFNATLQDFTGKPLIAVFSNGRRANIGEIARIYLGSVANVAGFPTPPPNASVAPNSPMREAPDRMRRGRGNRDAYDDRSAAPQNARTVVVPSNVQWTNTGFNVTRGQYLRFEPSGEIRLSMNGEDMARAAGAPDGRRADKATIPTIPVGALIGRVGNGEPFSIGDTTTAFDMPANGRLFLGVNDDHFPDNSGNFVVKVWEP
jgi:hypothetical protein